MMVVTTLFVWGMDTVHVKQTRIPILIDRVDNVLFYLRVDAQEAEVLDEVVLRFAEPVNLDEVEAVKLYYSGTEAPQRAGQLHYAPVHQYVSSHVPGKTRAPTLLLAQGGGGDRPGERGDLLAGL